MVHDSYRHLRSSLQGTIAFLHALSQWMTVLRPMQRPSPSRWVSPICEVLVKYSFTPNSQLKKKVFFLLLSVWDTEQILLRKQLIICRSMQFQDAPDDVHSLSPVSLQALPSYSQAVQVRSLSLDRSTLAIREGLFLRIPLISNKCAASFLPFSAATAHSRVLQSQQPNSDVRCLPNRERF